MAERQDLTGQVFGRLRVICEAERGNPARGKPNSDGYRARRWMCRCECGNTTIAYGRHLRRGASRSCGCLRADTSRDQIKHGHSRKSGRSPEYGIWCAMRARCLNPNTRFYSDYGGRGITICREWDSFEQFLADMGPRPTVGHELDRINNDGPYASWNCRWATKAEQSRNRRNNVFLEWNGERKTLAEWVRAVDVPEATLRRRLRDGWPIERVLGTPRKATSR